MKILCTLALAGALPGLAASHGAAHDVSIETEYAPTNALVPRIRADEAADLVIATADSIDSLIAEGKVLPGSRTDLVLSRVGFAVREGAPHPAIRTREEVVATLLAARSIAYSAIGASGVFFAGFLPRLGIADQVNAKATIIPGGFTAALAASGEVELAVQQISELMAVKGIEIVGTLPDEIGSLTIFSAGIPSAARNAGAARAFAAFLASAEAAPALRATGLEPLGKA